MNPERELERLRAEMAAMADWFVSETGYPIDMGADLPLPAAWRTLIEDAHLRNSDTDPDDPYAAEFRQSLAEHGGWENG